MPYSEVLLRRAPCIPGGSASRSIGHFGLKHRSPLRNSFICSRRHILQTGSTLRAISHGGTVTGVSWQPEQAGAESAWSVSVEAVPRRTPESERGGAQQRRK